MAVILAACAAPEDLSKAPEPLGDFSLGYNIVVVDNPKIGPLSRKATDAEWKASLEQAIDERFSRFKGEGTYHIAIKVQAYALAQTGIPLVVKPKSVLLISANVWTPYGKLNAEPENLTVWEGVSEKTLLGSGLTQTREEQMRKLSVNAARKIEEWLREHPEWFTGDAPVQPGTSPQPAK
ncbi:hypothetical protein [Frigidibacter sp. ROC022]|uniref:hypothetical protein n=1 Tax=Frigidibacter sp. ROC022 TaxID=2971796 RepID=UPI00215B27AD|nr:hypothetical protein [Frigidibacter sp. ROC022]MCR8726529.1 hypothetical protein [Frigidibacter sp. ROC022]